MHVKTGVFWRNQYSGMIDDVIFSRWDVFIYLCIDSNNNPWHGQNHTCKNPQPNQQSVLKKMSLSLPLLFNVHRCISIPDGHWHHFWTISPHSIHLHFSSFALSLLPSLLPLMPSLSPCQQSPRVKPRWQRLLWQMFVCLCGGGLRKHTTSVE